MAGISVLWLAFESIVSSIVLAILVLLAGLLRLCFIDIYKVLFVIVTSCVNGEGFDLFALSSEETVLELGSGSSQFSYDDQAGSSKGSVINQGHLEGSPDKGNNSIVVRVSLHALEQKCEELIEFAGFDALDSEQQVVEGSEIPV